MPTLVKFGRFLARADLATAATVVVAAKGALKLGELPALTSAAAIQPLALPATAADPLHADEAAAPPSSVTVWSNGKPTILAQFANDRSRNMPVLRVDKVRETVASAVPAAGDALLALVVADAHEAWAAGLAVARNWPVYNKKTGKSTPKDRTVYVDFVVKSGAEPNYAEIQTVADAIRNSQRLVDTPCAELHTDAYVQEVRDLVAAWNARPNKPCDVQLKVIQGEDLHKGGFGGLWGVGKAAVHPPALVVLSRVPANCDKTLALVGKGIVYDTGGLSLKGTANMCGMKDDMGGSAAVLGAFKALVETNAAPKTAVHALLCLAENAIDAKSYRNDDILHMYSGKTVEINNTDAEGRLVLADGVAYASRHLAPQLVVDIATLTGAQLIATGKAHAGLVCDDEAVEQAAIKAGKTTGDTCFPMLYAPELLKTLFESPVADMKNSVSDRANAQSSAAGHFVQEHLDKDYKGKWLHVDIAGPATAKERATGFGVALLYQLVKDF